MAQSAAIGVIRLMRRVLCLFGWHRPARGSVTREVATPVSLYRGRCRRCGHTIYRDQKTLKWKRDRD